MNNLVEVKTQDEFEQCGRDGDIAFVRAGIWTACGSSQVTACGSSQVTAYNSSQVTACDSSQVRAYDSSQVRACDSSQVRAYGSSQVTACGSSHVRAYGYVAITKQSKDAKIVKGKNCSLIVVPPVSSVGDFLCRYPIKATKKYAELYKAVKPDLTSINSSYGAIKYPESGTVELKDPAPSSDGSCANGLHFAFFDWAVKFGLGSDAEFVILKAKIPLDHIIVAPDCDGKVRTDRAEIVEVITDWQHYKLEVD